MSANPDMVKVLTVMGSIGEQTLKEAVDKVSATSKTVASIHSVVTEEGNTIRLQLIAREFFSLIEKGIRPSGKKPPPAMIELLTEYAQARGMSDPENAAWGIATNILNKGDKTHRQGGREVYSKELDKFVEEVTNAVMKEFAGFYVEEIQKAFK